MLATDKPLDAAKSLAITSALLVTWLAFTMAKGLANENAAVNRFDLQIRDQCGSDSSDFFTFLGLRNDARAADLAANARWLVVAFRKAGYSAELLANGDKPMVFASKHVSDTLPTILFYMHFDGQPVVNSQWHQTSPWIPTVKRAPEASSIQGYARDILCSGNADSNLRIVARSAADDKGPIMMFLAVVKAMERARVEPAVNVKLLLDSEEELGSPSIATVLRRYSPLLGAAALVIYDGPMKRGNLPLVELGNRGLLLANLIVWGPLHSAHSGFYANFIPNPAFRLARLLASMKDDSGTVLLPGFYTASQAGIPPKCDPASSATDAEVENLFAIHDSERGVACSLADAADYPTLNVTSLSAGIRGSHVSTIIPDSASAAFDFRTTLARSPTATEKLVRDWISEQGYLVLDRPPTIQERMSNERIATWTGRASGVAAETSPEAAVCRWVSASLSDTFGAPPALVRMIGATLPTGALVQELKMPFAIVPLVNADDNQHSFDENLRLGNFQDGIRSIFGLLTTRFPDA